MYAVFVFDLNGVNVVSKYIRKTQKMEPIAFEFLPATESFLNLSSDENCSACGFVANHVILYGGYPEAMKYAVDIISGRSSCGDDSFSTTTEVQKVMVPNSGTKDRRVYQDIAYHRMARAMVIDCLENVKSMDGIASFIADLTSWRDVSRSVTVISGQERRGHIDGRRTVILTNAQYLTSSSQMALRRVVERASSTSWLVFVTDRLGSLDPSLTSRFLCLNATPVDARGAHVSSSACENDEFFDKLITRVMKCKSCSELVSIKITKSDLENNGVSGLRIASFLKRLLRRVFVFAEATGEITEKHLSLIAEFARIDHYSAQMRSLVNNYVGCPEEGEAEHTPSDDVTTKGTQGLIACALAHVSSAVCASSGFSRPPRSNEKSI